MKESLLLRWLFLIVVVLCLSGCSVDEKSVAVDIQPEPVDLVLLGGKVETVDPVLGAVQAIAVRGFSIEAVGSDSEISGYIGPQTKVIELNARLAIPGFIEGHGHFMELGMSRQMLDLRDAANWNEIVSRVVEAVDSAAAGDWVLGFAWHQEKWDSLPEASVNGVPVNESLNAISPLNPVLLYHASGHAAFANDAALAAGGIDNQTPDPDGGTIIRSNSGKATGLLRESAANLVAMANAAYESRRSEEEIDAVRRERVRLAGEEALNHGITSFHDAGSSFEMIDFLKKLEAEQDLPVRLYVMIRGESNAAMAEKLADYRMIAEGNDFLTVRSIKRQIDGALGVHGAWLLEPYADMPSTSGLVLETVKDIETTAELAAEFGYQLNTHAIGTRANRETFDLYVRAWVNRNVQGKDLRWRIEHAQHLHPDDVPRFADLGVIAAMQGIHCSSDGPWVPARLGDARAKLTSYLWRDLLNSGAIIGNGTDVPVEPISAISSFYASVSRMTKEGLRFHPEQAMTRMEALRSYTINNAYAAFEENNKGSLTPGKLADIVVLSHDILTVEEQKIPETRVDYTIVGGEIRYSR